MADLSVTLFGPLDTLLGPYIEWALLAIVLLNFVSRRVAHSAHKRQAEDGPEALSRHPFHVFTLWGMVLLGFYYLTLHHHSGMVVSALVLGTFVTDIFEFEARKVEAREGHDIERPKGALLATTVTFLYVAFLTLFFVIKPYWTQVI